MHVRIKKEKNYSKHVLTSSLVCWGFDAGVRTPIDRDGFRNAIYTIDIGQNDLAAYMNLPYDQVLAKIPTIVAHIKYTIEASSILFIMIRLFCHLVDD